MHAEVDLWVMTSYTVTLFKLCRQLVINHFFLSYNHSAFKQFHQLYHEYRQSTDSECPMPEMVSRDGHINTEVFMPIEMISEKLPALKVGSYKFVWLLYM